MRQIAPLKHTNLERLGLADVCWKYGVDHFVGKVDIAVINSINNYYYFTFSLGSIPEGPDKMLADLLIQVAQSSGMRVNNRVGENSNSVVDAGIIRPSS